MRFSRNLVVEANIQKYMTKKDVDSFCFSTVVFFSSIRGRTLKSSDIS